MLEIVSEGAVCLIAWRFEGKLAGKPWAFEGSSVIHFADVGRVAVHRDHWDATQVFYERLPFTGWLLAFVRCRLSVD